MDTYSSSILKMKEFQASTEPHADAGHVAENGTGLYQTNLVPPFSFKVDTIKSQPEIFPNSFHIRG